MRVLSSIKASKDAITKEYVDGRVPTSLSQLNDRTSDLLNEPRFRSNTTITTRPLFMMTRGNRLALLPASQIIIEKSVDAGQTWADYGATEEQKRNLFNGRNVGSISIPLKNGKRSTDCMIRITITGMKYNVPDDTSELNKYNYWNSEYIVSTERYCQLNTLYFWVNAVSDKIWTKVERATGANSNNWINIFDTSSNANRIGFSGWSGMDYVTFAQGVFGGGITQTSNYWNYRITLRTCSSVTTSDSTLFDDSKLSTDHNTSNQTIIGINGYGDTMWTIPNNMANIDHMYTWDNNGNVTFPKTVTASNFVGTASNAAKTTGSLTIQKNGTQVGDTFNGSANKTINITTPTKTSDLTNDSGFITSYTETDPIFSASAAKNITSNDITNWNNKSTFSGNYNDLTNKPTIPTNTSDLENDGNGVEEEERFAITMRTVNNAAVSAGNGIYVDYDGYKEPVVQPIFDYEVLDNYSLAFQSDIPTNNNQLTNGAGYQTSSQVEAAINTKISSTYKAKGSVAFANLPALNSTNEGNVYNITDNFTTTSDFVEGSGKSYPAGTNVVIINTSGSIYKYDVLSSFIDLSGYQNKITSSSKLSSDLVDDTNNTNKFMTSSEKTKLSGIAAGAEVNKIDKIKVNNTEQTISNKTVNIDIPTKTSDLTNDSGYSKIFYVYSDILTYTYSQINGLIADGYEIRLKTNEYMGEEYGYTICNMIYYDEYEMYFSFIDYGLTGTFLYSFTENKWYYDEGTLCSKDEMVFYGTSSTEENLQAKSVSCYGYSKLQPGTKIFVKFTNGNSYDGIATLNVNNTGAKDIAVVGNTKTSRYYWSAGEVVGFVYDGTNYVMLGKGTATTTYYGVTKLTDSVSSTSTDTSATPNSVKQAYDLANSKQDTLVSGTNIKTINNQSILGNGNINIASSNNGVEFIALEDITFDIDDTNEIFTFVCNNASEGSAAYLFEKIMTNLIKSDYEGYTVKIQIGNNVGELYYWQGETTYPYIIGGDYKRTSDVIITKSLDDYTIITPDDSNNGVDFDVIYPLGSIYMSLNNTDPGTLFGGTWQPIGEGRTLIGVGTGTDANNVSKTFSANDTGGLYDAVIPYHNHTTVNAAAHHHSVSITSGGGGKHSHYIGADNDCVCSTSGGGWSVHSKGISGAGGKKYTNEVAAHTHSVSGNTGDAGGHGHTINYAGTSGNTTDANLQPYLAVYMWQKTGLAAAN